ncbi:hypothetical protein TURU_111916 [Turdus rufiventris]|nr:hypothetical protein TURU_111916 [Turdus rufiventris]
MKSGQRRTFVIQKRTISIPAAGPKEPAYTGGQPTANSDAEEDLEIWKDSKHNTSQQSVLVAALVAEAELSIV